MPEYYDYVKRDRRGQDNLADIGKTISDDLVKIQDERVAERFKNEQDKLAAIKEVSDVELGNNKTMNDMILNGVQASTKDILASNKLMKQNKITPQENKLALQAQLDDWATVKKTTSEWNKDFAEYEKRMSDGSSAGMEQSMATWNEEFGNVSNKEIMTDPKTKRLVLVTKNEDGSIDESKTVSVNALSNRMKDKVDRYDLNTAVQSQVSKLGQIVKTIDKDGILSVDDVRNNPAFKKAEDKMVTALMRTDRDISSILSDSVGGYSFTQDPKMKGKKDDLGNELILLKPDANGLYQPELTSNQEKAAREYVKSQLEMQLGHKETPKPKKTSGGFNASAANRRDKQKVSADKYKPAMDIALGGEDFESAVNAVVTDPDSGVRNIFTRGNDIVIQFTDGRGDQTIGRDQDVAEVSKILYKFIDPAVTDASGATEAYSNWSRFYKPGGAGEGGGTFKETGELPVSNVTLSSGEYLTDTLSGIFESKTRLPQKMVDVQNMLTRVELPGGRRLSDLKISKDGVISVPSLGEQTWSIPLNDSAPFALNEAIQEIINLSVADYNQSSTGIDYGNK